MKRIAPKTWQIDLEFQGKDQLIACAVLQTAEGYIIVDPGPTSTLPVLRRALTRRGISFYDIKAILLTHIHLDHAGATGSILEKNPDIEVYVHDRGALHIINPDRLIASAVRIYGDQMDKLWGNFLAVPKKQVHALRGGETLEIGGRSIKVAYTPGHASHHVSFLDESTGVAYVGDVAGIVLPDLAGDRVMPAVPPPDINLEQLDESLDKLRDWSPKYIFRTHFGLSSQVDLHLTATGKNTREWANWVREIMEKDLENPKNPIIFMDKVREQLSDNHTPEEVELLIIAGAVESAWYGLSRYWVKKAELANV